MTDQLSHIMVIMNTDERDASKIQTLKSRASEYMRRAEELKGLLRPRKATPLPPESNQDDANTASTSNTSTDVKHDIHLLGRYLTRRGKSLYNYVNHVTRNVEEQEYIVN